MLISFNDFSKNIEVVDDMLFGDLIDKLLNICNIIIYDIEDAIINNEYKLSELSMNMNISSLDCNIDTITISPRNRDISDHILVNKYTLFMSTKDDEKIARELQSQQPYQSHQPHQTNFINLLNRELQQYETTEQPPTELLNAVEEYIVQGGNQLGAQIITGFLNNINDYINAETNNDPSSSDSSGSGSSSSDSSGSGSSSSDSSESGSSGEASLSSVEGPTTLSFEEGPTTLSFEEIEAPISSEEAPAFNHQSTPFGELFTMNFTLPMNEMDVNVINNIATNLNATNLNATNLNATNLNATNLNATNLNQMPLTDTPTFSQLLGMMQGAPDFEDVKVVSTKQELSEIKTIKYGDFKDDKICKQSQCNICLDEYESDDELMVLNCDHYYHKQCIGQWLEKNSNKCPICRTAVSKGQAE